MDICIIFLIQIQRSAVVGLVWSNVALCSRIPLQFLLYIYLKYGPLKKGIEGKVNYRLFCTLRRFISSLNKNSEISARYVDQGGNKRPGAFAIYLEPWHPDIFDFLDLRKNTGKVRGYTVKYKKLSDIKMENQNLCIRCDV